MVSYGVSHDVLIMMSHDVLWCVSDVLCLMMSYDVSLCLVVSHDVL